MFTVSAMTSNKKNSWNNQRIFSFKRTLKIYIMKFYTAATPYTNFRLIEASKMKRNNIYFFLCKYKIHQQELAHFFLSMIYMNQFPRAFIKE